MTTFVGLLVGLALGFSFGEGATSVWLGLAFGAGGAALGTMFFPRDKAVDRERDEQLVETWAELTKELNLNPESDGWFADGAGLALRLEFDSAGRARLHFRHATQHPVGVDSPNRRHLRAFVGPRAAAKTPPRKVAEQGYLQYTMTAPGKAELVAGISFLESLYRSPGALRGLLARRHAPVVKRAAIRALLAFELNRKSLKSVADALARDKKPVETLRRATQDVTKLAALARVKRSASATAITVLGDLGAVPELRALHAELPELRALVSQALARCDADGLDRMQGQLAVANDAEGGLTELPEWTQPPEF